MNHIIIFILTFSLFSIGYSESTIQLTQRNGLKYFINSDKPFTGIYSAETSDGQKEETVYIYGEKMVFQPIGTTINNEK